MRALALCLVACFVFRINASTCELRPQVRDIVNPKEDVVNGLAEKVVELFERRELYLEDCECSRHGCTNEVSDFECSTEFGRLTEICGEGCEGRKMNFNTTTFRIPPNTSISNMNPKLKESICVSKKLDDTMKKLFEGDDNSAWLYFGGVDGFYRIYPAQARERGCKNGDLLLGDCKPYDPRIRPWFIEATTRLKDIVMMIGISRSMNDTIKEGGDETRLDVTKRAVSAILDTFSEFDYVSIVTFSDKATRLSVESPLLQGTKENVDFFKEQINNQNATGKANIDAAFSEAFDVLTEACTNGTDNCSGCQKVILFLTDGRDTSGGKRNNVKASDILSSVEKYQAKLMNETSSRAKIFTFSVGETSDDSIPRQIACRNDGAWSFIGEDTDPLTALTGYYNFLTNPRNLDRPVWSPLYEDDGGLGNITTVARPVFSNGTGDLNGVFLGVVGYDVFRNGLDLPGQPWEDTIKDLRKRYQFCNVNAQSPCQLQVYRNADANGVICADPISSYCGTPSRSSKKVQCYQGPDKYYKLFSVELSWSHALGRCRRDGGRLVVIESDKELAFVAGVASPDGSWIGLRRRRSNPDFKWLDRRSLDLNSSYWGLGQPNNSPRNANCVRIDQRGVDRNLNNENCEKQLSFICEYSNNRTCSEVVKIPEQEYCKIPPLSVCVDEEASLRNVKPLPAAEKLSAEDVMCPLGKRIDSFEAICCPNCDRTGNWIKRRRSALRQC